MKTTVMSISEYNQYMNKELTLRQIRKQHSNNNKAAIALGIAAALLIAGITLNAMDGAVAYAYVTEAETASAIQAFFIGTGLSI